MGPRNSPEKLFVYPASAYINVDWAVFDRSAFSFKALPKPDTLTIWCFGPVEQSARQMMLLIGGPDTPTKSDEPSKPPNSGNSPPKKHGSIVIRVRDQYDNGIPYITIKHMRKSGGVLEQEFADEKGACSIYNVPIDTEYLIIVDSPNGYKPPRAEQIVQVKHGGMHHVNIVLESEVSPTAPPPPPFDDMTQIGEFLRWPQIAFMESDPSRAKQIIAPKPILTGVLCRKR
jgi:hypothetical protein